MPTIDEILRARREASLFDKVQGGSSTTAPVPTIFDRLAPSSPMQGITLGSILERGGQTLGRLGREVPNEIAANYADIVELARQNPGAFGPAALPITLANIARGYQQGQERQARGGEPSLTETPFATHTSGDPTVKGAAMVADPGNLVGTGVGAKVATGLAKLLGGAKGVNQALIAFHGSPHKFDKFDMSKIGTGEGNQAFGHGLYFAENPGVARQYQKSLEGANYAYVGGVPIKDDEPLSWAIQALHESPKKPEAWLDRMASMNPGLVPNIQKARARLDEAKSLPNTSYGPLPGSTYKVDLPDEQIAKMIDWDKPLSQQPEHVKKALKENYIQNWVGDWDKQTGEQLYGRMAQSAGGNQATISKELRDAGIPGIRYLDQGSRMAGDADKIVANYGSREKALEVARQRLKAASVVDRDYWQKTATELEKPQSSNFVVFSDDIPKILSRE